MAKKEFNFFDFFFGSLPVNILIGANVYLFYFFHFSLKGQEYLSPCILYPGNLFNGRIWCLITSGFIHRTIGKWIQENIDMNSTFLDIGCGDLALRKYLPKYAIYNAFDISFSEYSLDLAMRWKSVNIAIASVTSIPLDSNQVSIVTATEVLEHIPSIEKALDEIYRVAKPNAFFW